MYLTAEDKLLLLRYYRTWNDIRHKEYFKHYFALCNELSQSEAIASAPVGQKPVRLDLNKKQGRIFNAKDA